MLNTGSMQIAILVTPPNFQAECVHMPIFTLIFRPALQFRLLNHFLYSGIDALLLVHSYVEAWIELLLASDTYQDRSHGHMRLDWRAVMFRRYITTLGPSLTCICLLMSCSGENKFEA